MAKKNGGPFITCECAQRWHTFWNVFMILYYQVVSTPVDLGPQTKILIVSRESTCNFDNYDKESFANYNKKNKLVSAVAGSVLIVKNLTIAARVLTHLSK